MVPLIAFKYVLEPVRQRKKFSAEKRTYFSLSSVLSVIFLHNFYLTTVSRSESRSTPIYELQFQSRDTALLVLR
jgi:hypothetical protein